MSFPKFFIGNPGRGKQWWFFDNYNFTIVFICLIVNLSLDLNLNLRTYTLYLKPRTDFYFFLYPLTLLFVNLSFNIYLCFPLTLPYYFINVRNLTFLLVLRSFGGFMSSYLYLKNSNGVGSHEKDCGKYQYKQ